MYNTYTFSYHQALKMQTFEISSNLKLTVEKGQYGKFVRLTRQYDTYSRWFNFTLYMWKKIRQNAYHIPSKDFHLRLSEGKEMNFIEYEGKSYVSFTFTNKVGDNVYKNYLNLNFNEWTTLLNIMPKMKVCHTQKTVLLTEERMKKTNLNPTALQFVRDNNNETQNQLGLLCEYCGDTCFDSCHCHKYNCEDCEPNNFCSECGELKIVSE